jgi:hypothetical protein
MARPLKYGLDYFPMDVDFFEDDKIQFVSSRFDEKGELISVKLLCKIFKAGYFIKWDEDVALLFAKGAGRNISPSLVNEVVNELIKRDFFHKGLFERFAILTSNGIQKRYEHICTIAKRKEWKIEPIYDVTLFTPEETPITPAQTQKTPAESTQRKVKESKENKSKGNEGASLPEEVFKELVLENPFSEKFLETWIIWKEYKKKGVQIFIPLAGIGTGKHQRTGKTFLGRRTKSDRHYSSIDGEWLERIISFKNGGKWKVKSSKRENRTWCKSHRCRTPLVTC